MKPATTAFLLLPTGVAMFSAPDSMAQLRGGFPGGGRGGMRGGGRDGAADSLRSPRAVGQQIVPDQTVVVMHELYEDLKLTRAQEPAWQA